MVVGGGVLIVFALLLEMGRELTEDPLTRGYIVVQGLIVISAVYLFVAGLRALDRASRQ